MELIAIVGKKRCGKDTAKQIISDIFGEDKVCSYMLSYPIKEALDYSYNILGIKHQSYVNLTFDDIDGTTSYDRESPLLISNKHAVDIACRALDYLKDFDGLINKNKDDNRSFVAKIEDVVAKNKDTWSVRRLMQCIGTDIIVNTIDAQFFNRRLMDTYLDKFDNGAYSKFIVTDIRQEHEIKLARSIGATIIHINRDINNSTDSHSTEGGLKALDNEIIIDNNGTLEEFKENLSKYFKGN